ncbi:CgeB family protein [Azospirillum rugosum]|uniref:Spore maturation protein CgeB n=1 Tax=Azospirillum rugosum TaxID=416170 RepID=A0ABS4SNT7_9PROT|nr:glycosyltransferase [Azospirillum rugosum]MBP2294227.1 spore maturation protein CgeB [Azospirillum rugosum]MDQ0527384.1 spore maturation protein CgeB [Azospirillum rugosum]
MKIVIFGLTISSSWGNGHATLWRGLVKALVRRGNRVVFFERDVPYYAEHRDLWEIPGGELVLYSDWESVAADAQRHADEADVAMVTSYCPDGEAASHMVLGSKAQRTVFYDLDTPVTLARLEAGERPAYLPAEGLGGFDTVLSYTGGRALEELKTRLGARHVAPLYGWVDPEVHRPVDPVKTYLGDLSYLGTYAEDRQAALEALFIEPARRLARRRFVIGGAQYPDSFPWTSNIHFVRHLPPAEHPAFFCSSTLTLNVTRDAMKRMGWCPSGRLFEAAACGVPLISDHWEGLEAFFEPGRDILVARETDDVTTAMMLPRDHLAQLARRARERTLEEHTAERRVRELRSILDIKGGGDD